MNYAIIGNSLIQSTFNPAPDLPGNLEAVVYWESNHHLAHYWRETDRPDKPWQDGQVVTSQATGPGAIIQSRNGSPGDFEVVVPEKGGLALYRHDNSDLASAWQPGGIVIPGSTGAASMIQNSLNGNLEVVVLFGTELRHFWRENGKWKPGVTITDKATGPASMIQSSFSNNLELVVPEGRNLVLYWQDSSDPNPNWKFGRIISDRATGPAGFVQGRFGQTPHTNFEVVVPEGDVLAHYWRDNTIAQDPPWRPGGWLTKQGGEVRAAALTASSLEGGLEILSQEENVSLFHYYRYDETKPSQPSPNWVWYRSSCLRIDEGPFVAFRGKPASRKITQLTGQRDTERKEHAFNRTEESFGIRGTDLGASFKHGDRVYFLFGDTHWTHGLSRPTDDAIAYTLNMDAENGLALFFHLSHPEVVNPSVDWCEYDVPVDGFGFRENMFAFFTTDGFRVCQDNSIRNRKVMGRSILARSMEKPLDFEKSRADTPLRFQYLTEFSSRKFINVSVELVGKEAIEAYHLPAVEEGLLIWGTGAYRADNVYLAFLSLDNSQKIENLFMHKEFLLSALDVWYFTGSDIGLPRWSKHEDDAVPLFFPAAIGELSVRWNSLLGQWVMMYMPGPRDPIGLVVSLRTSQTPWGPWSQRRAVFDWGRDGLGKFIHRHNSDDELGDFIFDAQSSGGGGAYAPYQLPHHSRLTMEGVALYYVLSTWNPYQVVLMRHDVAMLRQAILQTVDSSRIISWWRAQGVTEDAMGRNPGAAVGEVTFVPGIEGLAFHFNGKGFVEVPESTSLQPDRLTAMAWVRNLGSPGNHLYVLSQGAEGCVAASYGIYTGSSGGLAFYVSDGSVLNQSPEAGAEVWDGKWHFLAGTYDGTTVRLYVDGSEVGQGTLATIGAINYALTDNRRFYIGAYGGTCDLAFNGDVNDVLVLDHVLTAEEIKGIQSRS